MPKSHASFLIRALSFIHLNYLDVLNKTLVNNTLWGAISPNQSFSLNDPNYKCKLLNWFSVDSSAFSHLIKIVRPPTTHHENYQN